MLGDINIPMNLSSNISHKKKAALSDSLFIPFQGQLLKLD